MNGALGARLTAVLEPVGPLCAVRLRASAVTGRVTPHAARGERRGDPVPATAGPDTCEPPLAPLPPAGRGAERGALPLPGTWLAVYLKVLRKVTL